MQKKITVLFLYTIFGFVSLGFAVWGIVKLIESPVVSDKLTEYGMRRSFVIYLSGTGSMYPTIPKGTGKNIKELSDETVGAVRLFNYPTGFLFNNKRYFSYQLSHGDIISFDNDQTRKISKALSGEEREFLKRVYALPGESIKFRDGISYLNGKPQREPYIARARSTFGGETIEDCREMIVPPGKIFVMGDNRKASNDSRSELGFISYEDITGVIPLRKQKGVLDKHWRDTSDDLNDSSVIKLNIPELVSSINFIRDKNNLAPLKINTKLEKSALKRAQEILDTNDFSPEATISGYSLDKSFKDAGYSNIVWSEFPLLGHYDNNEFIETIEEFPRFIKIFNDQDFQDIGIAEITREVDGCPKHIVVTHFGGYVPPNYTQDQISSWKQGLESLREVYPGWKRLITSGGFYEKYKQDIDRMIYILDVRIKNMESIIKSMDDNEWLTDEQTEYLKKDDDYAKEQRQLADKLNASD